MSISGGRSFEPIRSDPLELGREMSQKLWCPHDTHAADFTAPLPHEINRLNYVVHMPLRIDPAWNGKAQQLQTGRMFFTGMRIQPEHDRANFDAADAALNVEFYG